MGSFGNKFSKIFSFVSIVLIIFVFYSFIYVKLHSKTEIRSPGFKGVWGEIYSERNFSYYLMFVLRRVVFAIIVFKIDKLAFQIMLILGVNILMTIYIAHWRPFMGRLELMNEMFMAMSSYHLLLFSKWVPTEIHSTYGWTFVGTIGVFIAINLLFVVRHGLPLHLVFKKLYNKSQKPKV